MTFGIFLKIFLQIDGLSRFLELLDQHLGKAGLGVIELEINSLGKVVGRAGSDIVGSSKGQVIPSYPRLKLWVAPEVHDVQHDIFLSAIELVKPKGKWIEFCEVERSSHYCKFVRVR